MSGADGAWGLQRQVQSGTLCRSGFAYHSTGTSAPWLGTQLRGRGQKKNHNQHKAGALRGRGVPQRSPRGWRMVEQAVSLFAKGVVSGCTGSGAVSHDDS